jgi:hypothetical protein
MKRTAIWVVCIAIWVWMFIDGGVGRIIVIVGLATLAVYGVALYITKKIIGPHSD